jgi:hypothetical protein
MAKTPKVTALLRLLSEWEKEQLRAWLTPERYLRQRRLLAVLETQGEGPAGPEEKNRLYEHLFEDAYRPDKDYLLRNEYRLLAQHVATVLVWSEAQAQLDHPGPQYDYYLLEALQRRQAPDLFEREFENAYTRAISHRDYEQAHRLIALRLGSLTEEAPLTEKEWLPIENLNSQGLLQLSAAYLVAFRQYQLNHRAINHRFFAYCTETAHPGHVSHVDAEAYEVDYAAYLVLKARSFAAPPETRIGMLKECLELAEHRLGKEPDTYAEEVAFAIVALARVNSSLGRFAEAEPYFERFLAAYPDPVDPHQLTIMADYVANQLNRGALGRAAELLATHRKAAAAIPALHLRWQCLEVGCLALRGDPTALAERLATPPPAKDPPTKHFFRFYYTITALLEGRVEDAFREIENLRHATATDTDEWSIHPTVNFFHRYFYTLLNHPVADERHRANLRHLARDLDTYCATAHPFLRSYLPLQWLRKQLGEK